nr:unnamed protein product [Haemonchus contortus]
MPSIQSKFMASMRTKTSGEISNSTETTPKKTGNETSTVRKGQSSPSIARLHPTETVRSLGALPSSLTMPSNLGGDCYSSTEYVQYTERHFDDSGKLFG